MRDGMPPRPSVIHSLGWYFPQSTGGTEVYVDGLVASLRTLGIDGTVAAPAEGMASLDETWNGTPVRRYPVPPQSTVAQRIGDEPHAGFGEFEQWLRSHPAEIYHQHSWTYGCGLHHLKAAKRAGLATVLTVHVPNPVCLRGTMMKDGRAECAIALKEQPCASCWLQSRGMPGPLRAVASRIPPPAGQVVRRFRRWGTAAAATALVRSQRASLLEAGEIADRIVAVCGWLHDSLVRNGLPQQKLVLNRQGVSQRFGSVVPRSRSPGSPFVVGFLGRFDPVKGLHVLVDAMAALPAEAGIELHAAAVPSREPQMLEYQEQLLARIGRDPRIRLMAPVAPADVPKFLAGIDVLAVPSQWLETGPMVILEAFASGIPVVGSRLGGIRELVRDGENGILVAHDNIAAWAAAFAQLAGAPGRLPSLRAGIGKVRTMDDVAKDTAQVYEELLGARRPAGRAT